MIDFRKQVRKQGNFWVKGRIKAEGHVNLPFTIAGYDRTSGWKIETSEARWNASSLSANVWCDDKSWAQFRCSVVDIFDFGHFKRKAKGETRKEIEKQLSCYEASCLRKPGLRKLAESEFESGLNEFVDKTITSVGPWAAALLGDESLVANLAGLARDMKLGLSRVKITDRGLGLDASVSVDSAWLGAHTPELHTPRRGLSNKGSFVVSFVAINRILAEITDRPFCTKVAPELRRLGLLGEDRTTRKNECALAAEFLGGENTLFGWTGLVPAPDFVLPLRVRPLDRTDIELYIADARPFVPTGDTAMGVFARIERRLARRPGGTWTVSSSGKPESTLQVALEAMPTGTAPASAWVRTRYDSISQLIDPRSGRTRPRGSTAQRAGIGEPSRKRLQRS